MKNLLFILLALVTLSFSSCKKEDDPQPGTTIADDAVTDAIQDTDSDDVDRDFSTDPVTATDDYYSFTTQYDNFDVDNMKVLDNDNITPAELDKYTSKWSTAFNQLVILSYGMERDGVSKKWISTFSVPYGVVGVINGESFSEITLSRKDGLYEIIPGKYDIWIEYEYTIHQKGLGDSNQETHSAMVYVTIIVE